jgi:uncharacterized membrane-anchored protein
MGGLLIITLFFQFGYKKYVPGIYWLAVVLISVVGTLITDNLTDNFEVSLETTTIVFSVALAVTFAAWYASERTLSIHTITTIRREAFYWLAILFTFALGTAAGDLVAEGLNLGYWVSALMFGALIAIVAGARFGLKMNAVLTFWVAYILTRPLGASIGDYLSQSRDDGGLGLGTVATSALFLITILSFVVYLSVTRKDEVAPVAVPGGQWGRLGPGRVVCAARGMPSRPATAGHPVSTAGLAEPDEVTRGRMMRIAAPPAGRLAASA